ncbi:pathogenesis-related protein PR-1-like [Nicotiana tabacum]|uniref:Pathogenesis-related protein PR-1-like n=1 Tax=Nicotiana tabacum TaxID=4097 RepID=A0A1S4CVV0_TOBAC|nr:pathogenesis-related protein PR-1-like [Nicotiana tomentosiformis]XP_016505241.1 PREDICTED: pathogenesis-related protein PR-1-like [Nicotiana tabacum]
MRPYYLLVPLLVLSIISTTTNGLTQQTSYVNSVKKTNTIIQQFLTPQNAARSALRLKPLVWDKKLANYATWYANQRRYDCELIHSNGPYGENIFWGSGAGWSPSQAVTAWLAERRSYNYWYNSCNDGECGHYTQIVWRESRRIGCAKVTCFNGLGVFMTCNYDPPGNYIGERPY